MRAHPAVLAAITVVIIAVGTVAILYATGPGLPTQLVTSSSSASSATQSPTGTSESATSSQSTQEAEEGQMAVLVTDPPIAPAGVTELYMDYDGAAIHRAGTTAQSGWLALNGSGVVELFQTVNESLTIGAGQIPFGTYNAVRFNVTGGVVTYYGQNYTANFREDELTAIVAGGIHVTANQTAAVLYDISPVVINWGTRADPQFLVTARAVALTMPSSTITPAMARLGFRLALGEQLKQEAQNRLPRIRVTNGSLSSLLLSATVANTGNETVTIRAVIVSPLGEGGGVPVAAVQVPILSGTLTFAVNSTGQLTLLSAGGLLNAQSRPIFETSGYNLTVGSSYTFTYSNTAGSPFALGFGLSAAQAGKILPGSEYLITVLGDQVLSSIMVVAGP